METSATREYPSLIHTFFLTHTVGGVFLNLEEKALYDEILRLQGLGSNTPRVCPTLRMRSWPLSDDKFSQMLTQLESQPEYGGGSGSGKYPIRAFLFDVSWATCRPGNLSPATSRPGYPEFVAGEMVTVVVT
nr:hypothetical protein [Tanacetum cinerariifolium]